MKNKVRIAVVGTGYFSKFHFDAWMRLGVNIVAICSLNKKEAIYYSKKFNVKDGLGIKLLQGVGIEIVFMSGGSGGAAEERAKQLGIKSCLVGIKDKYRELRTLQQEMKVTKSDTIYVGDDINDLVVKPLVNLLFAPSNASMSLLKKVDMELSYSGGEGAIRELAEKILISKGIWSDISENGWIEI